MEPRDKCFDTLVILQWNCRGFKDRAGELQQHIIDALETKPDVTALQQQNSKPKLPGYIIYYLRRPVATSHGNVGPKQHSCYATSLNITPQRRREHTLASYVATEQAARKTFVY